MRRFDESSPIIISGVGGSGTRVAAEIFQHLNYYLGNDLNNAKDNLWFTFLFKRPIVYSKYANGDFHDFDKAVNIFKRAMMGRKFNIISELPFIISSSYQAAKIAADKRGVNEGGRQFLKRIFSILFQKKTKLKNYTGWGWKEPNSHLFIERLHYNFPKLKYIHTIRNGLDMAFSSNQNQVKLWGKYFGINLKGSNVTPADSLKYWIAANKKVIRYGEEILKENFFVLNFEKLCNYPDKEIPRLVNFALGKNPYILDEQIFKIPVIPSSIGRFKNYDLRIFNEEDLSEIENLGFNYK